MKMFHSKSCGLNADMQHSCGHSKPAKAQLKYSFNFSGKAQPGEHYGTKIQNVTVIFTFPLFWDV